MNVTLKKNKEQKSTSWDKPLVFSPLESTDFLILLSRAKLPRNETAKEPAGSKKSVEKPKGSRKQASKRRTEKVPSKSVSNGGLERNHSHFPWYYIIHRVMEMKPYKPQSQRGAEPHGAEPQRGAEPQQRAEAVGGREHHQMK